MGPYLKTFIKYVVGIAGGIITVVASTGIIWVSSSVVNHGEDLVKLTSGLVTQQELTVREMQALRKDIQAINKAFANHRHDNGVMVERKE